MICKSNFHPCWWLPNAHMQTLWGPLFRRKQQLDFTPERLELDDGDFLDIAWIGSNEPTAPIVLLLHGLGGSIDSHYVAGTFQQIINNNWRGVFIHFRGCSTEPNRLVTTYHFGETKDIQYILELIHQRYPQAPIFVIGYSLGGNVLLKYLGETRKNNLVNAAIAISVPFDVANFVKTLQHGFAQVYQKRFLNNLRSVYSNKLKSLKMPVDENQIAKITTLKDWDEEVTTKLYGFQSADDYYQRTSCRQFLKAICKPTLILHAADDPMMTPDCIPSESELSDDVILELAAKGGHVGFVVGANPLYPEYWLEERIVSYLSNYFR